jgi:AmmeMemoRadiSam system protein A
MSSPEAGREATLIAVAQASIEHGFRFGAPLEVDATGYPPELRAQGASFVTLRAGGALRGCIGTLEARRPLVADVAHNAFAAANRDPRFPPLHLDERNGVEIHVSVLSTPEPLRFASQEELLAALEPGVHGLWISAGARSATFLPQVWEQLPEPRSFLDRLLAKAGLPPGIPCRGFEAARYTVQEFAGPLARPHSST